MNEEMPFVNMESGERRSSLEEEGGGGGLRRRSVSTVKGIPLPQFPPSSYRPLTSMALTDMAAQDTTPLRSQYGDYNALKSLPPPRDPMVMECNFQVPQSYSLTIHHGLVDAMMIRMKGLGWFVLLLWPHLLLGLAIVLIQWSSVHMHGGNGMALPPDARNLHALFGTILSFTIGFRTNTAYRTYVDAGGLVGKLCGNIREVVSAYYVAKYNGQGEGGNPVPLDVRRRLNILYAFVRQGVRESVLGFIPGSQMEDVPFNHDTFFLDPIRPRLWDLMSEEDVKRYSGFSPAHRPLVVVTEIRAMAENYALQINHAVPFINKVNASLQACLDAYGEMQRIRDDHVPFPYLYILSSVTFVFCYCTPFLYRPGLLGMCLGIGILIFAYYGMLAIALQLENPFRFDSHQLDLERFGMNLHQDTCKLAQILANDYVSFIPDELQHRKKKPEKQQESPPRAGQGQASLMRRFWRKEG